jgi:nitric oxide reductase large subunit
MRWRTPEEHVPPNPTKRAHLGSQRLEWQTQGLLRSPAHVLLWLVLSSYGTPNWVAVSLLVLAVFETLLIVFIVLYCLAMKIFCSVSYFVLFHSHFSEDCFFWKEIEHSSAEEVWE